MGAECLARKAEITDLGGAGQLTERQPKPPKEPIRRKPPMNCGCGSCYNSKAALQDISLFRDFNQAYHGN